MVKKWLNGASDLAVIQAQQAEAKKKSLTGVVNSDIILRKDVARVKASLCIDSKTQIVTEETIKLLGSYLKEKVADNYPDLPCPVIAGGAVRDMLFGLTPKDYDIFVDVSNLDPDEADDVCLLLTHDLILDLADDEQKVDQWRNIPLHVESDAYERNTDSFCVYETHIQHLGLMLQVIGRREKPLDTIAGFDYSLVKALYDPETEEVVLHDDFYAQIGNDEIECETRETRDRIQRWLNRHREKINYKIKCAEQVKVNSQLDTYAAIYNKSSWSTSSDILWTTLTMTNR